MTDKTILRIENLSKQYRLGLVGTGTIRDDLKRYWYKIRGKEDPFLTIGETNDRSTVGLSDYIWALKNINLEVKKGEVLGIIGANGAGKSTLLKILSKITTPTTGSIKFNGRIASLLEVGTGFHGELTGRENIYLNGAILGMTKAEITVKLNEIIEFSGCERYIDTPVKRYSSGMNVRLAFAVAAFLEPDILIVDEVLAVGDAEFQKKAIGKMQDISRGENGRTVLFVSHDMVAIQSLCPKTILLQKGEIELIDKTEIVLRKYLSKNKKLLNSELKLENPRIISEVFLNNRNLRLNSGDNLKFTVCFIRNSLKEVTLGYLIRDERNHSVHAANSQQYDKKFKIDNNKGRIEIEIENLPLIPGNYFISIYLGNGSYDIDIIENAISFSLFWDNKLEAIKPKEHWGVVFALTKWNYL